MNNLKPMMKEKMLGEPSDKKPSLLKSLKKPMIMPAKKSGLAARLTGGK